MCWKNLKNIISRTLHKKLVYHGDVNDDKVDDSSPYEIKIKQIKEITIKKTNDDGK